MNNISLFLMCLACMSLEAAQITLKVQPDKSATQKPSAANPEVTKKSPCTQTNLSIKNSDLKARRQNTIEPSSPNICCACWLSFCYLCANGDSY